MYTIVRIVFKELLKRTRLRTFAMDDKTQFLQSGISFCRFIKLPALIIFELMYPNKIN